MSQFICSCGMTVTTPCCPQCGRRARPDGSLKGLLLHCRRAMGNQRTFYQNRLQEPDGDEWSSDKDGRRQAATVARWESWIAGLERVLASQEAEE